MASGPGHPFYDKLSGILKKHGFDAFAEKLCAPHYSADGTGRVSIPPGVYFRMTLIGYFEGIDSDRAIAWRVADSLALRRFLGYGLEQSTPEHSSLTRIRARLDLQTHQAVFDWVLKVLAKEKVLRGKTIGIDATTLEANAALRSIVRRDTGASYQEFLKGLAKAAGIEEPSREDLARIDRKRAHKGSNQEWEHPHDPDAAITKMKDGRTHLAHKAEHAVDMETGAVVAVTLNGAEQGDPETMAWSVLEAEQNLKQVAADPEAAKALAPVPVAEVVADKGYHCNETMTSLAEDGIRSYISEPNRGKRNWKKNAPARRATHANRRRLRGARGQRLRKMRGEILERTFAHVYDTGGMRRLHLRGRENILKRLLVHVSAFNLGLIMRKLVGFGTPRALQGRLLAFLALMLTVLRCLPQAATRFAAPITSRRAPGSPSGFLTRAGNRPSSTGC